MQYEDTIEIGGVTGMRQTAADRCRAAPPIQFQPGRQGLIPSKGSMTDLLEVATGDRVSSSDVLNSPLRERMISLRGSHLLLLGILVRPLVMAGYVALAVLLFLPLLGLRRIFRRPSTRAVVRRDGDAPRHSGVGNVWDAATRSA